MKTSSAKAKGRRLQQMTATALQLRFGFAPEDCISTSMGAQGCDVKLSSEARKKFPFGIECKNTEKLNVWAAWKQAEENAIKEKLKPLLIFSRNHADILVVCSLQHFLEQSK